MPAPDTALSTLRPDLAGSFTEFDLAMDRMGFIGNRVLPVIDVAKASGSFGKIPIEQLLKTRETKRSPGGGYARGQFTFTPVTFATEEHGAEEPVDDNEAELYSDFFQTEVIAAQRAMDAVLRNQEKRIAAAVFNATTWTGSALTTAITNEWDDATNAVPITDMEAAIRKVWDGTGIWPNTLIINRKVFRNLRLCVQIIDRMKAQGFVDVRAGAINESILATLFDIDRILVAGSAKDSAKEGQSTTVAPIWSDEYAMICRLPSTADIKEPCVGRTMHWAQDGSQIGGTVESYREEQVRSDIIRVRHQVDEVILYAGAGHLLSNVTE